MTKKLFQTEISECCLQIFFYGCYDFVQAGHIESIGFFVIDFKIHNKCK